MKKQIFAAATALCLLAGTSAFAQKKQMAPTMKQMPTVEEMAQRKTERMTRQLNLTDAQAKKVYEINYDEAKNMQAMRQQMRQARNAEAEQMKSVLSTEQFMEWAQMQPGPGRDGKKGGIRPIRKGDRNWKECPAKCDKPCPKKDKE